MEEIEGGERLLPVFIEALGEDVPAEAPMAAEGLILDPGKGNT